MTPNIIELEAALEAAKTHYGNTVDHEHHALVTHYKETKVMAARAVAQIQVTFNGLHNSTYVGLRNIDMTYLCKAKCMVEILEADPDFMATLSQADELQAEIDKAEAAYLEAVRAENTARQAKIDARDKATKEALAKIEAEFSEPVPEAPQEPAPPFRGRNLKPALATA